MTTVAVQTTPLQERLEYSKALSVADLLPPAFRNKPANVLLAMEAAVSLGKSPMEIIQNAHVINGKLGFSAEFQRALVLESGHRIRVAMQGDVAVAQGIRSDDPDFTYEVRWDAARARAAGLGTSDNWKKHTNSMLKARATTELCRDAFADVIRGYRTVEELQDTEPARSSEAPSRPGDALRSAAGFTTTPAELEDEPIDAELVADVTESLELITPPQMKKLQILFKEKGFTGREDALGYVNEIHGISVASSKELTKDQASTIIEALEKLPAAELEPTGDPA